MDLYGIMNNYDYPVGSDTPDAPWNQELDEEVEVLISVTYSKSMSVLVPKGISEVELKKHIEEVVFKPHEALGGTWLVDEFEIIKE